MITLSFREKEKGWTSFYSYEPEQYLKLGNICFTNKEGQLWEQNDADNPITNTFYGIKYLSKLNTFFNEVSTDDKIFKTFVIEGSDAWDIKLKTNLTETTLSKNEFNKRESRLFAHLRQNENTSDLNDLAQGIGAANGFNISTKTISFDKVSEFVNIGDVLFAIENDVEKQIGTIVDKTNNDIIIDDININNINGLFFYSIKNRRVDGGDIRGYYAEIEMKNDNDEQIELFAINSNVVKSYV